MNLDTFEIETDRLLIKPVTLEYAKDINEGLDKEVTRYMFPKPAPLEATVQWIKKKLEEIKEGSDLVIVILNKETGEFIGGGGLHNLKTKTPEFGIWTKKSTHGNHFGREAVAGLEKWADENLDYEYLIYPADVENIPSRKIAEYLGGKETRTYWSKNAIDEDIHLVEYRIYKENKCI